MKRICVSLITLILCAAMAVSAQASPGDAVLVPPDGQGSFYTMAAMEGTLYLLAESGLYAWKTGDEKPELIGILPEQQGQETNAMMAIGGAGGTVMRMGGYFIDHLLTDGGKLYELDSDDGSLYLLEATDSKVTTTKTQTLKWDGISQNQGGVIIPGMISSPVIADGYLYLIKSSMDSSANELIRFNLTDGGYIKYDAQLVAAFVPYKDGKALILQYASQQEAQSRTGKIWMNTIDLESGMVTKGIETPVSTAEGLAYDKVTDTAAFFSGGEIYAVDHMASCRLAGYAPVGYQGFMMGTAQMLPEGLYAFCGEHVSIRSIAKGNDVARALRIQNAMESSYREFAVKRPDIPVVLKDTPIDTAEMLMQDMMGGGSDLYSLRIDSLDFPALMQKGYTASLSGSDVLQDQVTKMYPFLQKELMQDGDLRAFPVSLTGNMLGYSKKAMEELGMTEEDLPKTFAELMEFITNWDADYGVDHPALKLFEGEMYGNPKDTFFGWIMDQYSAYYKKLGKDMTFDTELMKMLLAALESADFSALEVKDVQQAMEGAVTVTYASAGAGSQPPTALFNMYYNAVVNEFGFMPGDFSPLPIALDDGLDPVIPASLTVYIVNPYSANHDLAMAYLEHFTSQRSAVSKAAMSPEYNEPVISGQYEIAKADREKEIADIKAQMETAPEDKKKELEESLKRAEEVLGFLENIKWQLSAEQIAAYRLRAGYLSVNTINPLALLAQDQSMAALIGRYSNGQIGLTQLIKELEQKLQMLYREGK